MQEEILFAGFGGQGVMFIGQLLAYAAMDAGYEVTWIPSYGPEMRGGTAHCYVVIADDRIGSPVVSKPSVLIGFNNPSFEKYEKDIRAGGLLVSNSSMVQTISQRTDVQKLRVPATEIADSIGNPRLANVVLLAATLSVRPIITADHLRAALEQHLPVHHRNKLSLNLQAVERGLAYTQGARTLVAK